jgi:hypothetical protein
MQMRQQTFFVLVNLMELLFPHVGFIISIHPPAMEETVISNMELPEMLAKMIKIVNKNSEGGFVYVHDQGESVKN